MAEQNANDNNWFGSWINAAKNKGSEVLEFVKKDLEEFGSAVKNEATNVVSSTGAVLEKTLSLDSPSSTASNMKRSFSSFLGQMNNVLNPSPDDSDAEMLIVENSETVTLNKFQKALYELQKDPVTYLEDPDESLRKQYNCWLEIIDDQLNDDRIAKHVNSSEILKQHYAKLVPDIVEHQVFWKRYLFKKALLEDDLARQEALEKREQKEKQATEENLKWDQEDFAADIELTEEQQIELLEQYENEKKVSQKSSQQPIGETVVFKQESPKRKGKGSKRKPTTEAQNTEAATPKENDLSASITSTPSSNSSLDLDWEKISDTEK
ncbi:BSD domain-containing protein 1-B isoform X1 [Diabrotica virgifera virgifera]|uniref:BSD domain-containing protein n=1 Tax=Diabrotica virgifera virgifera TaxID=50390 RepID=A0ABM5K3P7_DIAVI|nr:BSD domain-containing protein 1-B isoform X1 [Diabrotica virgifera virgifera]